MMNPIMSDEAKLRHQSRIQVKVFRIIWSAHKWVGISLGVVFLSLAPTGFLLLVKKDFEWIQPPTHQGRPGTLDAVISIQTLFQNVFKQGHEDFQTVADIKRVDFRPKQRVYKVQSIHNYSEIQVDAISGEILLIAWRASDLIESIHDGYYFGSLVHAWLMPIAAFCLFFLVLSGFYFWIWPKIRRRVKQKTHR